MGYYSTMEGPLMFRTHCTKPQEIDRIFQETFQGNPVFLEKVEDLGYEMVHKEENGVYTIYIESDSYTQKHLFDEALAVLVSKLIARDHRTYLIFTGEDNLKWGYAIAADEVHDIEFIYLVNGERLEDWLAGEPSLPPSNL